MRRIVWLGITLLLMTAGAQAGMIDPALQTELDSSADGDFISVIVNMDEQAPIAELNEDLKTMNATRQLRHKTVVEALQSTTASQEPLKAYLEQGIAAGSVRGYTGHWISNLIIVSATKAEILSIADRSDVGWIELNFRHELMEPVSLGQSVVPTEAGDRDIGITPGLVAIRADRVWYELGYTGVGTLIGSMDTGVDGNHPALTDRWRGNNAPWQECWLDVLGGGSSFPNDGNGHGTHTTGTMTGVAPNDSIGVAWEAEWIATNCIAQGVGSEFDNDVVVSFEWFADPDGNPNTVDDVPDVIQNSWRVYDGLGYPDCFTDWYSVLDNVEAAGCVLTWSAGNEGPGSQTIGSPPDRAETVTNSFSVGAVNALNPDGWPYSIASWSSRGPSDCPSTPETEIKPEVVAPGVNVYSSVPGGGYSDGYSGTSMAGPHVAGTVALMREANPNLDVDTVKLILMETARDEGTTGEDNTYGWGFIDAHAAVIGATVGFGTLEGYVRNGSYNNLPIPGATVELLETGYSFTSDGTGHYIGSAAAESYTARASRPGFASQETAVELIANEITLQDFSLTDIAGPEISAVTQLGTTLSNDPYLISAEIFDASTIAEARIYYRVNDGGWLYVPMTLGVDGYEGLIPGQIANSKVDYYIWAEDGVGLTATNPFGAPSIFYTFYITELLLADDAETETGWTLGVVGDNASSGLWIRDEPVGTEWNGAPVQPDEDHTDFPGTQCYVTGNANPGDAAGTNDVDDGCTTLLSPVYDLSAVEQAFVSYHRWYGQNGNSTDDEFAVDVSDDGGATWVVLERVPGNQNDWLRVTADINALVDLTDQVMFRFQACDLGNPGLVEAAIDDLSLESFSSDLTSLPGVEVFAERRAMLMQNQPNPFRGGQTDTSIQFSQTSSGPVKLQVFDISGRLVTTLVEGARSAGSHTVHWDGKDARGHSVGSGVYFYRLEAQAEVLSRRLTVLR